MRRGFTLVELSIVLVIIGLLIGGILVARSMVATTKVQAQLRQISQFDAALNNFKTKYNAVPGDYGKMGCPAPFCDDGFVQGLGIYGADNFGGEQLLAWVNLQQSGFMEGKTAFSSVFAAGGISVNAPNPNLPQSTIDPKSGVMLGANIYAIPGPRNVYQIANYSAVTPGNPDINNFATAAMSASDAQAIDSKMDDGVAGTGNVYVPVLLEGAYIGHNLYAAGVVAGGFGGNDYCSNHTSKYLVGSPGITCALAVVALSQQ